MKNIIKGLHHKCSFLSQSSHASPFPESPLISFKNPHYHYIRTYTYTMEAPPTPAVLPQHFRISQHHNPRPYGGGKDGGPVELAKEPSHSDDNNVKEDRCGAELRAQLDCNLTSLCDHIQLEGFNNGSFSDVVVHAMGSVYHLHRLILSRSSYFRFVLFGQALGRYSFFGEVDFIVNFQ